MVEANQIILEMLRESESKKADDSPKEADESKNADDSHKTTEADESKKGDDSKEATGCAEAQKELQEFEEICRCGRRRPRLWGFRRPRACTFAGP